MKTSQDAFEKLKHTWPELTKSFACGSTGRSLWQVANTLIPFFALQVLMVKSLQWHYGITLMLAVVTAGLWLRIFVLFHDCCHGSFFRSRRANDFLGFFLGVIVLTPYKFWRKSHAIHHAQSGKLEGRGIGDITTMTVQEYRDSRPAKRFMYRVFRNPILQFLIAPALYFGIYYRFTQQYALSWKEERKSVMLTNAVLALFIGVLVSWIGWQDFLWLFIPTFMITTSAGVWLFYVQHQYEHTYWRPESEWEYFRAAVHGASFYKLPRVLQWFTANIGFHHVHHLNPRIPNYRLKDCHEANEFFESAEVLTFWKSLRMMFLLLWDEQQQRMITLAEYKKRSVTV